METIEIIREILEENQGIDPSEVTEESTFDSLNIDSLDMVQLVCELEDRMGIDFGDPEGLETLGELIEYVDTL